MEDAETLAQTLPTGASAAVVLFEHTWTRRLTDAVRRAGGVLFSGGMIAPTAVDLVEMASTSSEESLRRQEIANTCLGQEEAGMRWSVLDLAAEAIDVDMQQMAFANILITPDMLQ